MKNLKPIKVKILYDEKLKEITGKDSEETMVSGGLQFPIFLNFIFSSYPEIKEKFSPGTLGFLLNKKVPKEQDILQDGDKLEMMVVPIEKSRKIIESQISDIINYYQVDITFEKIKEAVFNEDSQEDFNKLIEMFASKIDNLNECNRVLQIVNMAWNFFPHKSLNGLSPMEKLNQYNKQEKL